MLTLRREKMESLNVGVSTAWLIGACMEARGKQELWTRQRPEILANLKELAIVQSAESSNRIEGVTVEAERLRPIVLGHSKPRDRPEEEIVGYRQALNWIFSNKRPIAAEASTILDLHRRAQGGHTGDAGKWKSKDNEIVEFSPSGERRVRFVPAPAAKTPRMIDELCANFRELSESEALPQLLIVAVFVFDFLCVHPFRDGNGRVSRLLTTLLLQEQDFTVARFISLERIVEETKDDYYSILGRCSQGWHQGKNEIVPWCNYFLANLKRAYDEFALRVEHGGQWAKNEIVRQTIRRQTTPFALADIQAECPSVSLPSIKKVLQSMKEDGELALAGRGRGALWTRAR